MVSQRGGAGEAKRRDLSAVKSRRATEPSHSYLTVSGIHPLGRLQHRPLDLDQSLNAFDVAKLPELVRSARESG